MKLLMVWIVLLVAAPALARKGDVPPEVEKAARELLKDAGKSKWYRAFKKQHPKEKPLVGVYLATTSTDGRFGRVEKPDGPATAIVRKQGAFAVLLPNGKKPAGAFAEEEEEDLLEVEGRPSKKKKSEGWTAVANLQFDVNLVTRTIQLELIGGAWHSPVQWVGAVSY